MIRILHLGTELTWRGGENQMRLLIEGLHPLVEAQFAATPTKSVAYQEKRWACETMGLVSGNPLDPRNIASLVRFIKKNRINILDAHTAKAHTLALKAALFVPELKVIVHRRVDNVPKNNFFTKRKYFNRRVTRFTAISDFIGQVLKDYGINPEKIRVARSAVNGDIYADLNRLECQQYWRSKFQIPNHHVLIGNASALSPQKGYETLLRSISELKKNRTDFSVLIAGDGGLQKDLIQLSGKLNINDQVHFTGFIKEVPRFLKALDILAVPSNNEGLGTIILDGLLAGCSVVASQVGGIPEMIQHEKTGLLQAPGDHESLAKNLSFLIDNRDKRLEYALQGQQLIKKEFSLDSMVQGNFKIYQESFLKGGS